MCRHGQQEADEERIAERKKRAAAHCGPRNPTPAHLSSRIPIISPPNKFLFCPVAKAASTFWNRFVLTLNTSGTMKSPFSVPLPSEGLLPKVLLTSIRNEATRNQFIRESLKAVFVRDPYHRMFSAYVDKAFAPNPYYWNEWGSRVPKKPSGPAPDSKGRRCYHQLTFRDVMFTGATLLYRSELHFMPVFQRCHPCDFKYDVIGKMETFPEDLRYLSNRMNLSLTEYFSRGEFRYDYAKDAIEDSINSPFWWLTDILRCMDKMEMGLRVWRKLQIRGLIHRRTPFPYSKEEFVNVTADQFIEVATKAYVESTDRAELKRQKRDAFVEAYRTVDIDVLFKFKTIFVDDFKMFGYESEPADVFDRTRRVNVTGAFDWSKPWTG